MMPTGRTVVVTSANEKSPAGPFRPATADGPARVFARGEGWCIRVSAHASSMMQRAACVQSGRLSNPRAVRTRAGLPGDFSTGSRGAMFPLPRRRRRLGCSRCCKTWSGSSARLKPQKTVVRGCPRHSPVRRNRDSDTGRGLVFGCFCAFCGRPRRPVPAGIDRQNRVDVHRSRPPMNPRVSQ